MIELTQERLATLARDNFAGTIEIGGDHNHKLIIELPFGNSAVKELYNNLLNLTNEKGAYKKLLQDCRDDEVRKEYEATL